MAVAFVCLRSHIELCKEHLSLCVPVYWLYRVSSCVYMPSLWRSCLAWRVIRASLQGMWLAGKQPASPRTDISTSSLRILSPLEIHPLFEHTQYVS